MSYLCYVNSENISNSSMKIAGDLLDLVGDGAFETVQDLIMVRSIPAPSMLLSILSGVQVCNPV